MILIEHLTADDLDSKVMHEQFGVVTYGTTYSWNVELRLVWVKVSGHSTLQRIPAAQLHWAPK